MDFQNAAEWVTNNEATIKGYVHKYRNFSPYEESDFMQEAYESAMIAIVRSQEKGIPFESAFWVIFRNQINEIIPHTGYTKGSNSVPSHLCTGNEKVLTRIQARHQRQPDIEGLYNYVCQVLTEKERTVLSLSLGLGDEGRLSLKEIAQHLGCVESNVRDTLKRGLNRIHDKVTSGAITLPGIHRVKKEEPWTSSRQLRATHQSRARH